MSKLVQNCTRDTLGLADSYRRQNPDSDIDLELTRNIVPSPALYLYNRDFLPDPWSRESMEYLISLVTSKVGGYKRLGYLKYCSPIILSKEVSEAYYGVDDLTIWQVFTLEPFIKDWYIPDGYNKALRKTPKYYRWRKAVIKDKTHCEVCGERVYNLLAHHDPELDALLKMYRIKCTDGKGNLCFRDAYGCKGLWDVKIGMAICRDCHEKIHPYIKSAYQKSTSSSTARFKEPSNGCRNDIKNDLWNIRESVKTVYYRT